MSEAQRMLLQASNAAMRISRAAQELAIEIPLEPGLDEEEETAEEEEELTEGEEARAESRAEQTGQSIHLDEAPPNKSGATTASPPSE